MLLCESRRSYSSRSDRRLALQATTSSCLLGLSTPLNVIHLTPATSTSLHSSPPTCLAILQNSSVKRLIFRPEASPPLFATSSALLASFAARRPAYSRAAPSIYWPTSHSGSAKGLSAPFASLHHPACHSIATFTSKSALVLAVHENVTWTCTRTCIHAWSKGSLGFCQLSSCRDS